MNAKQDMFGTVALRRGYITREQLATALAQQRAESDGVPRLLGLIMLDLSFISTGELIEVLREVRSLTTRQWMKRRSGAASVKDRAS